jgi:transcriptional regulator with XRE-family HTH domain
MEPRAYLREYRDRAGLTLRQAAEKLGVVAQTIHKWEQGQNSPSIPDLLRLAKIYDIHPAAFFMAPNTGKMDEAALSDSVRVYAAIAGIHPCAMLWINGDFSRIEEAEDFTRLVAAFEHLPPKFREHWLKHGETYPLEEAKAEA